MSINILHISDLHFVTKADKDKTRYSESFVECFINEFKNIRIDYLIVSGDIADKSKEMEYKTASEFLNKVVSDLKIHKKTFLFAWEIMIFLGENLKILQILLMLKYLMVRMD